MLFMSEQPKNKTDVDQLSYFIQKSLNRDEFELEFSDLSEPEL